MRLRVGYARYLSLNGAGSSKPSRAAIDREAGAIVRRARAAAVGEERGGTDRSGRMTTEE